jgi:hypothetical protein
MGWLPGAALRSLRWAKGGSVRTAVACMAKEG